MVKTKEYKDFVEFHVREWHKERRLFYKTAPDWVGIRMFGVKGWLHSLRNFYKPFKIIASVTIAAVILSAIVGGYISLGIALVIAGVSTIILMTIKKGLDLWLDRKVDYGTFGKPTRPDLGYKNLEPRTKFRYIFWSGILLAKLAWNFVVTKYLVISFIELWGATWFVAGLNLVLVFGLLLPFALFFFLDTFSFFYIAQAITGYLYGKSKGL